MLITKKISHALLLVCLSISMASCGFHLRGEASLASENNLIYVTAPRGSFELELSDALTRSGAQLSKELAVADMHVHISQARQGRELGTLNERGTVDSYRLTFTVSYRVLNGQGEILSDTRTLIEDRQYVYEPSQIIETEFEEQALRQSMEKDIALRMVRQLSVLTDSKTTGIKSSEYN